jgi:hypothetical protein
LHGGNHLRTSLQREVNAVKKFVDRTITLLAALGSAAAVAYAMAHVAHYNFGIPRSDLREQALICAGLIVSLVTIEFLASKE